MKPILFNAPMARAMLDGSKTQTRRVADTTFRGPGYVHFRGLVWMDDARTRIGALFAHDDTTTIIAPSRYKPGDMLYVRETWAPREGSVGRCYYRADGNLADVNRAGGRWRPSIHMLNAQRGCGWAENPWVFVYTFERVEGGAQNA